MIQQYGVARRDTIYQTFGTKYIDSGYSYFDTSLLHTYTPPYCIKTKKKQVEIIQKKLNKMLLNDTATAYLFINATRIFDFSDIIFNRTLFFNDQYVASFKYTFIGDTLIENEVYRGIEFTSKKTTTSGVVFIHPNTYAVRLIKFHYKPEDQNFLTGRRSDDITTAISYKKIDNKYYLENIKSECLRVQKPIFKNHYRTLWYETNIQVIDISTANVKKISLFKMLESDQVFNSIQKTNEVYKWKEIEERAQSKKITYK